MNTITSRLKEELMEKQGLTIYAIAKRLKVSTGSVDVWLTGRIKNKKRVFSTPNPEMLVTICQEFNLDLVYIMTGVKSDKAYPVITLTPKASVSAKPTENDLKDKLIGMYEDKISSLTKDLTKCKDQLRKHESKHA